MWVETKAMNGVLRCTLHRSSLAFGGIGSPTVILHASVDRNLAIESA